MLTWKPGDLNSEQEAAILDESSVFLIACPGSGKTRALTYKIAHEIGRLKSEREFVVAITYTNRAADEIHERVEQLGVDTDRLWIGTIHSFCLEWILKPYAIYHDALANGFRVINSFDSEEIITELCRPSKKPRITYYDCNYYFTDSARVLSCSSEWKHDSINQILDKYFEILRENRQIDYELILLYAYEILNQKPPVGALLSKIFSFVLIDEYQDTKRIQYLIVAAILRAGKGKTKTFIVGDPNQAIFESLGGFPISPESFEKMAEITLKRRQLTKNYRSPSRIIEYFSEFNVHETTIEAASEDREYPSRISYDRETHASKLAEQIIALINYNVKVVGVSPEEICVLAPQWVQLSSMTRKLVSGMPEHRFDGPGMVPFSRDLENFWFKLAKLVLTSAAPEMYVRRLRWATDVLNELVHLGVHLRQWSAKSLLRECNSLKIDEKDGLKYLRVAFETVMRRLDIDINQFALLKEHYESFFGSSASRIERLAKEGAEFIGTIETFRRVFQQGSGITVSTIHGIKGDEYDCVIAYGLLQGMVPHFADPSPAESASKLIYVICSRAKKNLHLISESGRKNGLDEPYIPTELLADYDFGYDAS